MFISDVTSDTCHTCGAWLREPYINCAECTGISLCSKCFSNGAEHPPHLNFHSYSVVRNEFPLWGGWPAKDEILLLESMAVCGPANWAGVAKCLKTRSEEDCKKHYSTFYIENPFFHSKLPPSTLVQRIVDSTCPRFQPAQVKTVDLEFLENPHVPSQRTQSGGQQRLDLSRPVFECRATQFIAGYNAARGEFTVEFDDNAEANTAKLEDIVQDSNEEDPDHELLVELQTAIVQGLNLRLKERQRRKKIIKQHGLLLLQKTIAWLQRFEVRTSCYFCFQRIQVVMFSFFHIYLLFFLLLNVEHHWKRDCGKDGLSDEGDQWQAV